MISLRTIIGSTPEFSSATDELRLRGPQQVEGNDAAEPHRNQSLEREMKDIITPSRSKTLIVSTLDVANNKDCIDIKGSHPPTPLGLDAVEPHLNI